MSTAPGPLPLNMDSPRSPLPINVPRAVLGLALVAIAWSIPYASPSVATVGAAVVGMILAVLTALYLPMPAVEALYISIAGLLVSLVPFSLFVVFSGANPLESVRLMYQGAFGSSFSWQNTLIRAAPLMLTGLCCALPLRLGMVIIGGEGALVLGGLTAAGVAHLMPAAPPLVVQLSMLVCGSAVGGLWITFAASLKYFRGVNETISSLLLNYIAVALLNHLVEGPMHDPASLNNPSTWPIGDANMIGTMFGTDIHWGFAMAVVACLLCYLFLYHTIAGFSARIVGGNLRAARVAGLSVARITVVTCFVAGACAGLAGSLEVGAIHGRANASLIAGYGYTGILVAFLARSNPLAILPISILLGGIGASGGLLQRRQHLPDATVVVLQGIIFVVILGFETFYGRLNILQRKEAARD